ncbi:MAG: ribonuclease H-like domain-containing protein [Rickettsiales bacterium]|jgi:ribonuclease D|nr:ribonuclease H-like domain-containing protein [Rickettsiales bacterium]
MIYKLCKNDLPSEVEFGPEVAVDTEALGLNNSRDRLCLVQIYFGSGEVHIVHFDRKSTYNSPNLVRLLSDRKILKIFHYARFDMAIIQKTFGLRLENVYCTKIASKIARTYSEVHGLKALIREFFNIEISKKEQGSYWGGDEISEDQLRYAANDVLFLHRIRDRLNTILENENRKDLVDRSFGFLQTRVDLDLLGWAGVDIFCHQ